MTLIFLNPTATGHSVRYEYLSRVNQVRANSNKNKSLVGLTDFKMVVAAL